MKIKLLFSSFLFLMLSIGMTSCKTSLISKYDDGVLTEKKAAQALTNKLYDEAVANPDKSYSVNSVNYDLVSAQISAIKIKELARTKSALLLEQIKIVEVAFNKAKADHKKNGTLNNANLTQYQGALNRQWESVINSEKSLPKEKKSK